MNMDCYLRFPHFKSRAVTLSYDDGRIEDLRLVDVMRRYGLKGTLNLNSERLSEAGDEFHPTLNDFRALRESGDIEIAVHGAKHLRPTKFPTPLVLREIMADREALEKMFGTVVRGMAYAYGAYNDEVISALSLSGVAYARLATSNSSFDIPTDWLTLSPTAKHMNQNLFELTDAFLAPDTRGAWGKAPRLFYLWGHSIEFELYKQWDIIERFGEKMAGCDDIWHATNIEIYNYVEAFRRLVFTLDLSYVENPSAYPVYLNNGKCDLVVMPGETARFI